MPTGYQINDQSALYFITMQIVQWADIFTRQIYRDIVIDSLNYCRKEKGLEVFAYVIMSNHVHIIVRSKKSKLSDTIRDLKRHTSKTIIENIKDQHMNFTYGEALMKEKPGILSLQKIVGILKTVKLDIFILYNRIHTNLVIGIYHQEIKLKKVKYGKVRIMDQVGLMLLIPTLKEPQCKKHFVSLH